MIDRFIAKLPLGPTSPGHRERLSQVSYRRFSTAKERPTTTFIRTPLTGAQAKIRYLTEQVGGQLLASYEIEVALASSTVGHNLIHAGAASIWEEICVAGQLVRVLLVTLGLTGDELDKAMRGGRFTLVELTWHSKTASLKARNSALKRVIRVLRAQRACSRRHDVQLKDLHVWDVNEKVCVLAALKSGSAARFYVKLDSVYSYSRKSRTENYIPPDIAEYLLHIYPLINVHVRNELIAKEKDLVRFGLDKPLKSNWSKEAVENAIDVLWAELGLALPKRATAPKALTQSARELLRQYEEGVLDLASIPDYRLSRDRKIILNSVGIDILHPDPEVAKQALRLGKQLSYAHRWEPSGELRNCVLCEQTWESLYNDLEQGLQLLLHGEFEEGAEWRARWCAYAEREGVNWSQS